MKPRFSLFTYLIVLVLILGCNLFSSGGTTGDDSGTEGVSSERVPTSQGGTGDVTGSVWWNSRAAANIHVELCEEYSFITGCSGTSFSATSDENGNYLFSAIPAGTYYIAMRIFNTDDWLYIPEGFISARPFIVSSGETTVVEAFNLYKLDVNPTHPTENHVPPGDLTLSWRPYESAAHYEIILYPEQGESILSGQRVDGNEIGVTLPSRDCEYRWHVEAFNQDGIKIATTDGYLTFAVTGQTTSCVLTVTNPPDNTVLPSGAGVVLVWEAHAAAARYEVFMWNDSLPDRPYVLDFIGTTVPTLHIGQTLEPGRYVWSVRAFDEAGKLIAGSDVSDFTVE